MCYIIHSSRTFNGSPMPKIKSGDENSPPSGPKLIFLALSQFPKLTTYATLCYISYASPRTRMLWRRFLKTFLWEWVVVLKQMTDNRCQLSIHNAQPLSLFSPSILFSSSNGQSSHFSSLPTVFIDFQNVKWRELEKRNVRNGWFLLWFWKDLSY